MTASPTADPQPAAAVILPPEAFDWELYRSLYDDLEAHATQAEAWHHFHLTGRAAGRLASAAAWAGALQALEERHGPLPRNFSWRGYRAANPSLPLHSALEAAEHYLREGRPAGLLYRVLDPELYRALYPEIGITADAALEHFRAIGQGAGWIGSLRDIAARHRLLTTAWLERIDIGSFDAMHSDWAGRVRTVTEAAEAMMASGIERLAALHPDLAFDPAYYAEANPAVAGLPPATRYRHWLFVGLPDDRPCSPRDHLRRHGLALDAFPEGFDWPRYAGLPGVYGDSRWALLDHLVANNAIAATAIPVRDPGAAPFLAALAATIIQRVPHRGAALAEAAAGRSG